MSEPTATTPAVPQPEDKQTEVDTAVEPSPDPAPAPVAPKEDVKADEPTTTETPAAPGHVAEPSATDAAPPLEPAKDDAKADDKPAEVAGKKEERPKSPSILSKILASLKPAGDKPKAERKMKVKHSKEEKKREEAPPPPAEEPVVPAEEPSPADAKLEDQPAPEPVEPAPAPAPVEVVKETDAPAPPPEPEVPVPDVAPVDGAPDKVVDKCEKEMKPSKSPARVARRLSARVNEFFKTKPKEVHPPAKVDEAPPKIEEPTPVAPLENPAADSAPANAEEPQKDETKESNEPPKVIDAAPAPVVAAA